MEGVQGVVDCGALLWVLVSCTEEYPLLCGSHLSAHSWIALVLQHHCQSVHLIAELPEVFVLPHSLVLSTRRYQYGINVLVVRTY